MEILNLSEKVVFLLIQTCTVRLLSILEESKRWETAFLHCVVPVSHSPDLISSHPGEGNPHRGSAALVSSVYASEWALWLLLVSQDSPHVLETYFTPTALNDVTIFYKTNKHFCFFTFVPKTHVLGSKYT